MARIATLGRRMTAAAALVAGLAAAAAAAAPAQAQEEPAETVVTVCSESVLRQAIADAPPGSTVRFACDGTVVIAEGGPGPFEIIKDLTLDATGRDVTISGAGRSRLFFLSGGGTVTMRDMTLTAGGNRGDDFFTALGGGAVLVANTTFAADRVRFVGNYSDARGGAISTINSFSGVQITDSEFVGNSITCGAICQDGGGGAISLGGGRASRIERTTFRENSMFGRGSGGAVLGRFTRRLAETGAIAIVDSDFEDNSASTLILDADRPRYGGGAVASFMHDLTIEGSRFTDNTAAPAAFGSSEDLQGLGGAVRVGAETDNPFVPVPTTRIADSTFTGNRALGRIGSGGALSVDRSPLEVVRSSFAGNEASEASVLESFTTATFTDSRIVGNTAAGTERTPGAAVLNAGRMTLSGTDVVDNAPVGCRLVDFGQAERPVFADGGGNFEDGSTCAFGAIERPALAIDDVRVREPESGETARVRFALTLSEPLALPLTVGHTTVDGSAAAGEDYDAATGEVTIPAGELTAQVPVDARGDDEAEPDEDFGVQLTLPVPGRTVLAGDGRGTATIVDDDTPPPAPTPTPGEPQPGSTPSAPAGDVPSPYGGTAPPAGDLPPPARSAGSAGSTAIGIPPGLATGVPCRSTRRITVVPARLQRRFRGARVLSAFRTSTRGRLVIPVRFSATRVLVDLRGLPRGRYTVRIRLRLRDGRTSTLVRRYGTCGA